jgi:hypothetical protein
MSFKIFPNIINTKKSTKNHKKTRYVYRVIFTDWFDVYLAEHQYLTKPF